MKLNRSLLAGVLFALACVPAGESVTAKVGPSGGVLESSLGARVVVPEGALSESRDLTLTVVLAGPDRLELFLSPTDVVFAREVALEVRYDGVEEPALFHWQQTRWSPLSAQRIQPEHRLLAARSAVAGQFVAAPPSQLEAEGCVPVDGGVPGPAVESQVDGGVGGDVDGGSAEPVDGGAAGGGGDLNGGSAGGGSNGLDGGSAGGGGALDGGSTGGGSALDGGSAGGGSDGGSDGGSSGAGAVDGGGYAWSAGDGGWALDPWSADAGWSSSPSGDGPPVVCSAPDGGIRAAALPE